MTTQNNKPNAHNNWVRAALSVGAELIFNTVGGIIAIPLMFLVLLAVAWIGQFPWLVVALALALIGIVFYAIFRYTRTLRRGG